MKYFVFIALLLLPFYGWSQDTTYYNDNMDTVVSVSTASYYTITTHESKPHSRRFVQAYFTSGQLKWKGYFPDTTRGFMIDDYVEYYKNGELHEKLHLNQEGKFEGKLRTYWPNGTIKRKDLFRDGKLVKGRCYNKKGKPIPHFDFWVEPEFPGGTNGLLRYLRKKIKYPKKAQKQNIQGTVLVYFVVDKDGEVTGIRIVKGVSEALDEEALKVVNKMPKWKPGKEDGKLTKARYTLPIRFTLR